MNPDQKTWHLAAAEKITPWLHVSEMLKTLHLRDKQVPSSGGLCMKAHVEI